MYKAITEGIYCEQSKDALAIGRYTVRAAKITVNAGINQVNSMMNSLSKLSKMSTKSIETDEEGSAEKEKPTKESVRVSAMDTSFDDFRDSLFSEYSRNSIYNDSTATLPGEITFDSMKKKVLGSLYERSSVEEEKPETFGSDIFSFGKNLGIGV